MLETKTILPKKKEKRKEGEKEKNSNLVEIAVAFQLLLDLKQESHELLGNRLKHAEAKKRCIKNKKHHIQLGGLAALLSLNLN